MTDIDPEVFQFVGQRTAVLIPEYFIGRARLKASLSGVWGKMGNCAWMYGPARNGKSSLGRRVMGEAEKAGKRVGYVDASQLEPEDFRQLLAEAVGAISGRRAFPTLEEAKEAFTRLAVDSAAHPTLLVFDEFDRHAPHLSLDEQAFLRATKETHPALNYLFISRMSPARIVEDVAVDRSRLLGICSQHLVPVFQKAEVVELCKRTGEVAKVPGCSGWSDRLWDQVGGHPVALMTVLQEALSLMVESPGMDPAEALGTALETRKQELMQSLAAHWRHLHPNTRRVVLSAEPATVPQEALMDAERDGYWIRVRSAIHRPAVLREVGQVEGLLPSRQKGANVDSERAERLYFLLHGINQANVVLTGFVAFEPTGLSFGYHHLVRPVSDENGAHGRIDFLSKLVYEGGRERKPNQEATPEDWRLSAGEARDEFLGSKGLKVLKLLRNYMAHDRRKGEGIDKCDKDGMKVGAFYLEACGSRSPSGREQWAKVTRYLLDLLLEALENLHGKLEGVSRLARSPGGTTAMRC